MVPENLDLYGQLVIDHTIHTNFAHESADLWGKGITWDQNGKITIAPESTISVPCIIPPDSKRTLFHLIPGQYQTGAKIDSEFVETVDWHRQIANENLHIRFGFDRQLPGGGAMNVSFGLYNIFRGIPTHLTSIYTNEQTSIVEDALAPMFVNGGLNLIKRDPYPSINAIIEGIVGDRLIIRSPRLRDLYVPFQKGHGEFVLVNSIYSREMAINALTETVMAKFGGVIACTASLCHTQGFTAKEAQHFQDHVSERCGTHDIITTRITEGASVFSIIKDIVMQVTDKITFIFNETELAHFTSSLTSEIIVSYKGKKQDVLLSGILQALQAMRKEQCGQKPMIIVTLGKYGCIILDQDDDVHFCGVLLDKEMERKPFGEKKAIGDLFASLVTGILFGREEDKGIVAIRNSHTTVKESFIPSLLIAASAGADSGVYDGFFEVEPKRINELICLKVANRHYSFWGQLWEMAPQDYAVTLSEADFESFRKGEVVEPCALENLVGPEIIFRTNNK